MGQLEPRADSAPEWHRSRFERVARPFLGQRPISPPGPAPETRLAPRDSARSQDSAHPGSPATIPGTVYLLVHPEQYGFKHGMALLRAPSWRGPYTLVASDTFASWGGSTANAEDPYLWIDKRGRWHIMYEGNPMPGGHAYSVDGLTWSNISMADGGRNEGAFNLSRPYLAANGTLEHISLYTERPKLLLGADGATPTHLYGGAGLGKGSASFTLASPLSTAARRTEGR